MRGIFKYNLSLLLGSATFIFVLPAEPSPCLLGVPKGMDLGSEAGGQRGPRARSITHGLGTPLCDSWAQTPNFGCHPVGPGGSGWPRQLSRPGSFPPCARHEDLPEF